MADERKVVVEIRMTSGVSDVKQLSSDKSPDTISAKDTNTDASFILHPYKAAERLVLGKNVLINQAYSQAKSAIKSSVLYAINRNLSLNENYLAQTDMNNALTAIGKVSSLGTTVGGAFLAGGGPNPFGFALAAVAAAGWVVNEGVQVYQRFDRMNIQLNETNAQTVFDRTRLGLSDGGKGTQN